MKINSFFSKNLLLGLAAGLSFVLMGANADAADIPEIQQSNGISYVSGGIADDSQQAMEQMAGDFNLRLTFAEADGSYLADIPVTITDAQGNTVLETTSTGPLFYANLEPGSYTVAADNQGNAKEQQVEVSAEQPASLTYSW